MDFQLVSATHRDLSKLVAEGLFREDLYYRLAGLEVTLPALRERSDKRELIYRVLEEEAGTRMSMDPDAEALLMTYPWPGNLRQLRHVLRTAAVLAEGGRLSLAALPPIVRSGLRNPIDPPAAAVVSGTASAAGDVDGMSLNPVQASERAVLLGLLEEHRWNVSNVAKALDISRNTLYRRLHRLRIILSHGDAISE